MGLIYGLFAIVGGAGLACIAPWTHYEKQIDIVGALIFISGLSAVGVTISRFCG